MLNKNISFKVHGNTITADFCVLRWSSNTVDYITASFDLDEDWTACDLVRAVWSIRGLRIVTVLTDGACVVPHEVLAYSGKVFVNLYGVKYQDGDEFIRITTYPYNAITIDGAARISGSETAPVTPSQFDQFVELVIGETRKVTGMTAEAVTLPAGSEASASYSDGVLTVGIPRGEKGDTGEAGPTGPTGAQGPVGPTGPQGEKGENGDTGEKGDKGDKGDTGADGISPTVTITPITGGHRITITDADGEHSADVMDGTGNVDDVQINGSSIVEDGVAKVPIAGDNVPGVVQVNDYYGIGFVSGLNKRLKIVGATESEIKQGTQYWRPSTIANQHRSVFYGLAKSAGDTTQSQSSNAVGNYTDTAKGKIQTMLGIADLIGNSEGATASKAYSVGDVLLHDGKLYKVTASIAQGSAIVPNTNCTQTTIIDLLRGV